MTLYPLLPLLLQLLHPLLLILALLKCCKKATATNTVSGPTGENIAPSASMSVSQKTEAGENLAEKWKLLSKAQDEEVKTDLESLKDEQNPLAFRRPKPSASKDNLNKSRNANASSKEKGAGSVYQGDAAGGSNEPKSQWANKQPQGTPTEQSPFPEEKDVPRACLQPGEKQLNQSIYMG